MLFTALSSGKQILCPSWGAPTRLQRKTAWHFWRSKRHTYPLKEHRSSRQSQSSSCCCWGFHNNIFCGAWSWTQATRATESTAFSRDRMSTDCSMQGARNRSPHLALEAGYDPPFILTTPQQTWDRVGQDSMGLGGKLRKVLEAWMLTLAEKWLSRKMEVSHLELHTGSSYPFPVPLSALIDRPASSLSSTAILVSDHTSPFLPTSLRPH